MQVVGSGGRIQLLKFSLHRNQEPSKQRSAMSTDRNNTDKSKYTYYGQQNFFKPKQKQIYLLWSTDKNENKCIYLVNING